MSIPQPSNLTTFVAVDSREATRENDFSSSKADFHLSPTVPNHRDEPNERPSSANRLEGLEAAA